MCMIIVLVCCKGVRDCWHYKIEIVKKKCLDHLHNDNPGGHLVFLDPFVWAHHDAVNLPKAYEKPRMQSRK